MRGIVAKRLRSVAQEEGQFFQKHQKYTEDGQVGPARFGRRIIALLENHRRKVTDYTVKGGQGTIRCHPLSVRGVYQRLKRQYKMELQAC